MKWTFGLFEVCAGHSLASMKYHHLILILAVSLALPTIALAKEKGTGATADVEATVKKIEQEILDGILKSDAAALEKYLTSDYLGIGPDGSIAATIRGPIRVRTSAASIDGSMSSLSAVGNGRSRSIRVRRSRNNNGATCGNRAAQNRGESRVRFSYSLATGAR
ncbi:MAG: hypothetical protein DME37_13305 [Verrucomicrobia bacterium]|nr:MAG: hypothetical protein DME37_13305 [Verrucomicrobiota bacterium]